jgi:hypothetical protein
MHPSAFGDGFVHAADFFPVLDDLALPGNVRKNYFVPETYVLQGSYRIFRAVTVPDEAAFSGGEISEDNRDVVVRVNGEGRLGPANIQEIVRIH